MVKRRIEKTVISGIMLAISIVIPQVFHLIPVGNPGGMFLPMHIPVILCGIICGSSYGCLIGMIAPLISNILTGMPTTLRLPFMMIELMSYGFFSGLFFCMKKKMNLYLRALTSLFDGMVSGRILYFLSLLACVRLTDMKGVSMAMFFDGFLLGIPGMVIQLIFIPGIIVTIDKTFIHRGKRTLGTENTFVCKKDGKVYKSQKKGVAPIVDLLSDNPLMLRDAYVADKVIGKAAALLLIKGGIRELYTEVISVHGLNVLSKHKEIRVTYDKVVPFIENRSKDGMCPMETATLCIDDPDEAYEAVLKTMEELKKSSGYVDSVIGRFNIQMPEKKYRCRLNPGKNNDDGFKIVSALTKIEFCTHDGCVFEIAPVVIESCMNPGNLEISPVVFNQNKTDGSFSVTNSYETVNVKNIGEYLKITTKEYEPALKKYSCSPCRNCGRC